MATTRATTRSSFEQVGTRAVQTARDAVRNPWVERLARCGLAARGVVYAVIGVLAVQAAFFGRGSRLQLVPADGTDDPAGQIRR